MAITPTIKFRPVHSVVANAPQIISVASTTPASSARYFYGTGAPSGTTLLAGNGKYNASNSGFIIDVQLVDAGSGYNVGDVLYCVAGSGTATQVARVTVDSVATVGITVGVITDWHVSTIGIYSVYSSNPVTTTNSTGSGTGATFNLNFPQPDFFIDTTTPANPNMWICCLAGSNASSQWYNLTGCPT